MNGLVVSGLVVMKRIFLIFCALVCSVGVWSMPHGKSGKVAWSYNTETQTLYITGTGEVSESMWARKGDARYVRGKDKWPVKNVQIAEGITSIADHVFENCNVEEFTIPVSLEEGHLGFKNIAIDRLYYKGSLEQWITNRVAERCLIRTRRVSRVFVRGMELTGRIVLPQSVTHLPAYSFSYKNISER